MQLWSVYRNNFFISSYLTLLERLQEFYILKTTSVMTKISANFKFLIQKNIRINYFIIFIWFATQNKQIKLFIHLRHVVPRKISQAHIFQLLDQIEKKIFDALRMNFCTYFYSKQSKNVGYTGRLNWNGKSTSRSNQQNFPCGWWSLMISVFFMKPV